MGEVTFSWDAEEAGQKLKKHRISFEEASTVFYDEKATKFFDPDHSKGEERFLMLGLSWRLRILVVCYCLRKQDSEIRIISARRATRKERQAYIRGQR